MATKSLPLFRSQHNVLFDVVNRRTGAALHSGLARAHADHVAGVLNSPAAFCAKSASDLPFAVKEAR